METQRSTFSLSVPDKGLHRIVQFPVQPPLEDIGMGGAPSLDDVAVLQVGGFLEGDGTLWGDKFAPETVDQFTVTESPARIEFFPLIDSKYSTNVTGPDGSSGFVAHLGLWNVDTGEVVSHYRMVGLLRLSGCPL